MRGIFWYTKSMEEQPDYYKQYSQTSLLDRFIHATRGIKNAWRKEPNFRIEALAALLVFGAMLVLPISNTDRSVLVLVIALVLVLEVVNSIFERVLDIMHPDFSEEVKKIKDTMAGVVFLASLSSVIVGLFILTRPILNFDRFLQASFEIFRTRAWVKAAEVITYLGDWHAVAGGTVFLTAWLIYKKRYELLSFLLGGVAIGEVFLFSLKWLFARERPVGVDLVGAYEYSFPSGHVFAATVFYLSAAFIIYTLVSQKKYLWLVSSAVILVVALTRMILSVHWFSDVLGGFVFGIFWLLLWYGINNKLWHRRAAQKI